MKIRFQLKNFTPKFLLLEISKSESILLVSSPLLSEFFFLGLARPRRVLFTIYFFIMCRMWLTPRESFPSVCSPTSLCSHCRTSNRRRREVLNFPPSKPSETESEREARNQVEIVWKFDPNKFSTSNWVTLKFRLGTAGGGGGVAGESWRQWRKSVRVLSLAQATFCREWKREREKKFKSSR